MKKTKFSRSFTGMHFERGFITSLFFAFLLFFVSCGSNEGQTIYDKGEKLKKEGRYEEAITKYRYVVLHYQKAKIAPEALFRIGEVSYIYLKDFNAAARAFRDLLNNYSWSARCKQAQLHLADIEMYGVQDFKQAIAEYQKAISYYGADKESERFQHEIAKAYFNLENFEQQRVELTLLLSKFPDSELAQSVYYEIANSYYIEGRPDEAIEAYKKVIEKYPNTSTSLESKFQTASCLEEKEDLKGAIEILKEIEGVYPNYKIVKMRIERIKKRLKSRRR
ncbi:MAG: tetratricopeptide repeat protein [Proteobacteria bacterium]|nr:tetratricopeptide repeat protein [Pseudomonadota bacterium]